jgi:hypothetical protein
MLLLLQILVSQGMQKAKQQQQWEHKKKRALRHH